MTTTPPTRSTASARISAGLNNAPREHLGERIASAYRWDPANERLLALRETRPEAYAALPASTRTGLALYSGSKAAAAALGHDVSAPEATS